MHLGFIGLSLPLKVMPFSLAFGLWPRFDLWKVWYCLQALFEVSCAKEATDAFQLKNPYEGAFVALPWQCADCVVFVLPYTGERWRDRLWSAHSCAGRSLIEASCLHP